MSKDLTQERLAQALTELADVQLQLDAERLERARVQELFDELFDSLSDGVLLLDPHGRISRCNRAAPAVFGRTAEELCGSAVTALYRDLVPATPWELLAATGDGHLSLETATVAADGCQRPVSLSCALVRDGDGKVQGAVHAARDLSEVHRLLHEVQRAEARWRLLADVSDQLAAALEPDDVLADIVGRLERETGCGTAVVLGRQGVVNRVVASPQAPGRDVLADVEGMAVPAGTALHTAMSAGRAVHTATVAAGFPLLGRHVPAVSSAAVLPLSGESGVSGAMLVLSSQPGAVDEPTTWLFEEVATRIGLTLANAELRDAVVQQRASTEATQYRNEVLAAVSHDMKTPLTVLLGLVDLLGDPDAADSREEIRAGITRQVQRLRRLVAQFLDYVRLEAGHELTVACEPVDPARVVAAMRHLEGESQRLCVDVPASLPPVVADEGRVDLALANLVTNALKYAPEPTPVTIRAREAGRHVEISVIDQGPGIALAEQGQLFDRFERGHRQSGTEGTGLGLYMTRQLMRSQGGDVRVASRPGEGSRFTLVLPRADADGS